MEPEGSLPHSQVLATFPYPEQKVPLHVRGLFEYSVLWYVSYGEKLLAPRPTPKLEDHPFSAVRDHYNVSKQSIHKRT